MNHEKFLYRASKKRFCSSFVKICVKKLGFSFLKNGWCKKDTFIFFKHNLWDNFKHDFFQARLMGQSYVSTYLSKVFAENNYFSFMSTVYQTKL